MLQDREKELLDSMGIDTSWYIGFANEEPAINQLPNEDKPLFDNIFNIINEWDPEQEESVNGLMLKGADGFEYLQYATEICAIFSIIKQGGTKENLQAYIKCWFESALDIWQRCDVKGRPDNLQSILVEGEEYIQRLYALMTENKK
jgi:hypothetical protein